MRCKNAGADYDENNIQWTCTASLPEEFKLGSTDVICEGYDSPDDPYILKGSCGLEYRLILTDKGHEKFGKGRSRWGDDDGGSNEPKSFGEQVASALFWLVFIGILGWIVYSAFIARQQGPAPGGVAGVNRPGWGGGGGGGGWGGGDDTDDPPPPYYDSRPGFNKQNYGSTQGSSQQGWRPGFWSGAVGGAAGAWAANRMANRGNQTNNGWGNGGGSGWGNGGGSNWNNGEGSSRSSSGSSFSSTRHESTGFGSTSRR